MLRKTGRGWTMLLFAVAAAVACAAALARAQVRMQTQSWANTDEAFAKFARQIEDSNGRNLLTRKGVTAHAKDLGNTQLLTDGYAGERGGEGRVFVNGQPTTIAFYLGGPKPITRVGLYTFNVDARANQDFEVRFADNSGSPGKLPEFPRQAQLTSGDKIIGPNSGGFHAWFADASGRPIVPGKVDWVEFRIWRTYSVQAGTPAKTDRPQGASAYLELAVFGDPSDVIVPTPQEITRRKALRAAPKEPPYVKQAAWQATMQAAREAMLEWECDLDRLMLPDWGAELGDWHVIGPLAPDSKEARELDRLRRLDLGSPLAVKGGTPIPWRKLTGLNDGELTDVCRLVAPGSAGKPGDVIYLARTLTVTASFDSRDPLSLGLGLGDGQLRLLPGGQGFRDRFPGRAAVPNQCTWDLSVRPGSYCVLARLPVAADGRASFWFMPQPGMARPGAGNAAARGNRREALFGRLRRDFPGPVSQAQITWEQADSIWVEIRKGLMARRDKLMTDWAPGAPAFLADRYSAAAAERADALEKALAAPDAAALKARLAPWLAAFRSAAAPQDIAAARKRYYAVATAQEAIIESRRIEAVRLAVQDQRRTWPDRYPKAQEYRARVDALARRLDDAWPALLAGRDGALTDVLPVRSQADTDSREILLANPLLADMGKLLLIRGGPGFASNWDGPNHLGNEIVVLSPVKPDGQVTTVYNGGTVSDMDLGFDARKILFSDGVRIHEIHADGTGHRVISRQTDPHVQHYDACYLPDGRIVFVSTACEQAVPCTGQWYVGNLHVMDPDGQNERRLTYDQDHNWNPCVLNSGRVLYTRWEYTDTPHYFSRLLFHMNPDGTRQLEYYGSNSYWPNAMYWPRPIPGQPDRIVTVVSGHHGVGRVGELHILDAARGRHEADGVVQQIPGRGKTVEPVILDGLVKDVWPRFATPYPLAEPGTNRGAGKYFLATVKLTEWSPWGLYLVDVFDNMTPLLMGGYSMPTPLRPRPLPPVVPQQCDPSRKDALVYMVDVYQGGGLKGYPRGAIKALRVGSHHYRYGGNGDTSAASVDGGWDVKVILGTVPVQPDGSAYFRVPANTPIFVQPLDAEGKAQQLMRSWFVAMPGEVISCVGCHERQNSIPPNSRTLASAHPPADITPWFGPTRGFSFDREVQPVLDRRCAGCHNPAGPGRRLDLRANRLHEKYAGSYSPAYLALHPYVRRAGFESDYHLPVPAEFQADTSHLVQMLKKGHHNVRLTPQEWRRLYAWIDFNVPYPANWRESHRPPEDGQVARRVRYEKLYAGVLDRVEDPLPLPPVGKFEAPPPEAPRRAPVKLPGWPLATAQSQAAQKACGLAEATLDLGGGQHLALVPIPAGKFVMGPDPSAAAPDEAFDDELPQTVQAIDQPFYMARFEITNAQYALFDPLHDSGYIDARGKDRFTRGYPANEPDQPVVRVTWHEATAFCRWLSDRAGQTVALPTEAQWEYACRAGTDTPWHFGRRDAKTARLANNVANLASNEIRGWNWGRGEDGYSDGERFLAPPGRYPPNAWGLCDMHGNVAEWTLSAYKPYPYAPTDGRDDPAADSAAMRAVRGGSWNDTARFARSAHRWRYPPYQPVYNVGFRVIVLPGKLAKR